MNGAMTPLIPMKQVSQNKAIMNYTQKRPLTKRRINLVNYLPDIGIEKVRAEILKGLGASPKYISPKFFYNEKGAKLFEAITKLEAYYPTRTEKALLSTLAASLNLNFSNLSIIELGSGDSSKIQLLLQQAPQSQLPALKYYPVDISQSSIERASEELAAEFPMIQINGIVADFIHQLSVIPKTGVRLFCFFGSTIGNLSKNEIKEFMRLLGAEMQRGDSLLLGVDMVKDPAILEKAYNDDQQITADFNRNVLNALNNLAGTNFEPAAFEHLAFYNEEEHRIEMHLRAVKDMVVAVNSTATKIHIKKGETIHTENSHKFNKADIRTMGLWAGLQTEKIFIDDRQWFSLAFYKKTV